MKTFFAFILFTFSLVSISFCQQLTDDYCNYEIEKIESEILNTEKEILISLPDNYVDSSTYPIVIVLESEVLFETLAPLTKLMDKVNEIPACIVVGIPFYNQHFDYAPHIDGIPESGNANKMIKFYKEELFTLLESKYHGNGEKIIWAHSGLGGIFCTFLLLGPDNQFSGILSSSPNLKFVQQYIIRNNAFDNVSKKNKLFYYLTIGSKEKEGESSELYWYVNEFHKKLEASAPENLNWHYRLYEQNNHFSNAIETYMDGLMLYFEEKKHNE